MPTYSEAIFSDSLARKLTDSGYTAKREANSFFGVPDIIYSKLSHTKIEIRVRNNQRQPIINEDAIRILLNVPDYRSNKTPVSVDKLSSIIGYSKSRIKKCIQDELIAEGYLVDAGGNRFYKVNGWIPITHTIYAVESKLRDWKKALMQAIRYKYFANFVYVALPISTSTYDIEMFKQNNVGLLAYDPCTTEKTVIFRAQRNIPIDRVKHHFMMEYLWEEYALSAF